MLSANARYPVVAGALGEAGRGRVGLLDGVYGGLVEAGRDIFADPDDGEPTADPAAAWCCCATAGWTARTTAEGEPAAVEERRADAVQALAERRGVRCRAWSPPRAARRWSGSPR